MEADTPSISSTAKAHGSPRPLLPSRRRANDSGHDAISPGEIMLQVPEGNAEMLSIRAFRRELGRHEALFDLIGRYTQTVIAQMMQSAACNSQHQVTSVALGGCD